MSEQDHFATERRRVKEAFEFFDREGRGLLVKEEVGTIMRYLGAFPSEEDIIKTILPQMQDDEEIEHVKYEKFERYMVKVMAEREFEPASEEVLLQAFKVRWVFCDDHVEMILESTALVERAAE